jgi:exonuclease SbcC
MRITYVELENIKSYSGRVNIPLTPGLNAVSGLNGSGKTTVLEAIGYAVFNFLPYKQEAFVREGQKFGTIRVGLLARDERAYEIVRRVGSSGQYFVSDLETGTRLADRHDEVGRWVREYALNTEMEADLAALFKNAVGVPQGLMTADFQTTATTRKAVFDPLLRVEEYRDAWEHLRETTGYLRDRTATVDAEIARLEGETEKIPFLEEQAAGLRQEERRAQDVLDRRSAELAALLEQRQALDEVEHTLAELRDRLAGADYDVRRCADRLARDQEQLEAARGARRTIEETRPGYHRVVAAGERLRALSEQSRERDTLNRQLAEASADRQQIFGGIQQLDAKIRECAEAAQEASSLVDPVSEQDALDARLRELQTSLRDRERIESQISGIRRTIGDLERVVSDRRTRIAAAVEAQQQSGRLETAQRELEETVSQLAQLEPLKTQRAQVAEEGKRLKERNERLQADADGWAALQEQIDERRSQAEAFDELSSRHQELRDRRAEVSAAVAYQSSASSRLGEKMCPLLDLECPIVATDARKLKRLETRASSLAAEAAGLDEQLSALSSELDVARGAAAELQTMLVEAATLGRSRDELGPVASELEACRERYRELSDRIAGEGKLRKEQAILQAEVTGLQSLARTGAELPLLQEQDARDTEVLALQQGELARLSAEREGLDGSAAEANEVENRLTALGDPRQRQQALLAIAARKAKIESSVAAEQEKLSEAAGRVKALTAALLPFETLDEQMEAEQATVTANQDAYERYLGCRDEAEQVEGREEAVKQTTADLQAARERTTELEQSRQETEAQYDAARHHRLRVECEETRAIVAREDALLEGLRSQLKAANDELSRLHRQREKLLTRRGERDKIARIDRALRFIRDIINRAGPAVTEHLLRNISQGANDIYEEIMDDHAAELRWDRNYEVLVQRGAETRAFVQLSGGEQMSAALAVRLALLKEMSDVDFAFFDEPTQNMDGDRRSNLADQIRQVRGFEQLIVISHDDTFEHHTDNLIRLRKENEETVVDM